VRFAVHRPGIPAASPRSHGVPRRDVPGRIHISVVGVSASRAHEPRLALARVRIHLPACPQPVIFGAGGGELSALLQIAWRTLAARTPVRVLLNREIPYVRSMRAVAQQHRFVLGGRGIRPASGHANTLSTTADIPKEVKRRFLHGLKARVSTPRSR
jgi:hypothetical protein